MNDDIQRLASLLASSPSDREARERLGQLLVRSNAISRPRGAVLFVHEMGAIQVKYWDIGTLSFESGLARLCVWAQHRSGSNRERCEYLTEPKEPELAYKIRDEVFARLIRGDTFIDIREIETQVL